MLYSVCLFQLKKRWLGRGVESRKNQTQGFSLGPWAWGEGPLLEEGTKPPSSTERPHVCALRAWCLIPLIRGKDSLRDSYNNQVVVARCKDMELVDSWVAKTFLLLVAGNHSSVGLGVSGKENIPLLRFCPRFGEEFWV